VIIDEVALHNFGVYRGRQTFRLTPESPERPVVLIGAQNGGGKTTFLDALQLAFFGKLAQLSSRAGQSYEEYLNRSINRGVPPQDGAAVEVTFRRSVAGTERTYHIRRSWVGGPGVRERFEVVADGKLDLQLSERWAEFIEEALPPRIAPLFFFDGERIEQIADPDRSGEIIRTAIHALLGLDIVDRLRVDLEVLERRKAMAAQPTEAQHQFAAIEGKVREIEEERSGLTRQLAETRNERTMARKAHDAAQIDLRNQGGDLFEQRNELAASRDAAEASLRNCEQELRILAADIAPLLLVRDLLDEVRAQAAAELETEQAVAAARILQQRDRILLERLQQQDLPPRAVAVVRQELDTARGEFAVLANRVRYLNLSPIGHSHLAALCEENLTAAQEALIESSEAFTRREAERDALARRVAGIPAEEIVARLVARVEAAEARLAAGEARLTELERRAAENAREAAFEKVKLRRLLNGEVEARLHSEDTARHLQHSEKVRETLEVFRRNVVEHHVHRIETQILDCLQTVLRKDGLIADVKIDPRTFAITLMGGDWRPLTPDQLSAGERQLFAVSILWALARASGRAMPTVIDTPLGRLDSRHRKNLVERYFPRASHQVVLLSTDEEIDERHVATLEPSLSRAFTIEYDEAKRWSSVREGYLFEET
jgi:DNA sulfur modification protein DndD